jgi:orotate phosphoribosyltransferase
LEGRVLIIDDVITAGTAIREIMSIINQSDAEAEGVVIGVDRQERGTGVNSAIQEVEMDYSLQVFSIIDITDILTYLQSKSDSKELVLSIKSYREKYGVS